MRASILVVDNFYKHPLAVRDYALRQPYYYPYQRNADVESGRVSLKWMSSRFKEADSCPFKSSNALIEILTTLTGDAIDLDHWRLAFPTQADGKAAATCEEIPHS